MLDSNAPLPDFPDLSLSIEEQFRMRTYREAVKEWTREELETNTVELARLLMIKDRVVKSLMRGQMDNCFYSPTISGLFKLLKVMVKVLVNRAMGR